MKRNLECAMRNTACAWLLLFLAHAMVYRHVLFSPPCYDQAGLFVEADYLYETGLSYRLLPSAVPLDQGGPKSYVTTLLPGFVATLRLAGASPLTAIGLYRLFTWACNATLLLSLFGLLRTRVPWATAALACLSLHFLPLWSTQAEMVGMEIPTAMFAVLSARWALGGSHRAAILAAILSFLMKNTGIAAAAGLFAYYASQATMVDLELDPARRPKPWRWAGITLAVVIAELGFAYWGGGLKPRTESAVPIWLRFQTLYFCCGDLVLLWCLAILGAVAWIVRFARESGRGNGSKARGLRSYVGAFTRREPLYVLGWAMVAANWMTTLPVVLHPRYFVVALPFLFVVLAVSATALSRRGALPAAGFALLLAVNLVNSHGALFPRLPLGFSRVSTFLERDHAYLANHRSMVEAGQAVTRFAGDRPILAGEFFTYAFTHPAFGYSKKSLHGYTTLDWFYRRQFRDIVEILHDRPKEVVVVAFNESFRSDPAFEYPPPDADDRVLFRDDLGIEPTIVVYAKRFETPGNLEKFFVSLIAANDWGRHKILELLPRVPESTRRLLEKRLRQMEEMPDIRAATSHGVSP